MKSIGSLRKSIMSSGDIWHQSISIWFNRAPQDLSKKVSYIKFLYKIFFRKNLRSSVIEFHLLSSEIITIFLYSSPAVQKGITLMGILKYYNVTKSTESRHQISYEINRDDCQSIGPITSFLKRYYTYRYSKILYCQKIYGVTSPSFIWNHPRWLPIDWAHQQLSKKVLYIWVLTNIIMSENLRSVVITFHL
jgi:hypothetical protein